jgi:hypothetical protein
VADLLAEAAKLSIRRGGLSVAVEWLHRAAALSTDPARRTAVIADAVFLAARADQPADAEELLEIATTGEGDSALTVLAECYQGFHADGEVTSSHRRILDALARASTLDDKTLNRLVYLLISITNYAHTAGYREQTNAALLRVQARLDPAVSMYRTGVDDFAGTANTVRAMLRDWVALLPQVPPQRMVLLSFPAYCAGVMADFRAPLQAAFEARDTLKGRQVHTSDGQQGLAMGVGPNGALRIQTDDLVHDIVSSEISVRPFSPGSSP